MIAFVTASIAIAFASNISIILPPANFEPRCASEDYGWPRFNSIEELRASKWAAYYTSVYGALPTAYPICVYDQVGSPRHLPLSSTTTPPLVPLFEIYLRTSPYSTSRPLPHLSNPQVEHRRWRLRRRRPGGHTSDRQPRRRPQRGGPIPRYEPCSARYLSRELETCSQQHMDRDSVGATSYPCLAQAPKSPTLDQL